MGDFDRVYKIWQRLKPFENLLKESRTPYFMMDEYSLRNHMEELKKISEGKFDLFYVYKTCPVKRIFEIASEKGFGAEVVNLEEMQSALSLGGKIIFNGLDKSDDELKFALENQENITIILDNLLEIKRLEKLSPDKQIDAGIRLSIKGPWERFGLREDELDEVFSRSNLKITGLHVHNGIEMYLPYYKNILKRFKKIVTKHRETLKNLKFVDLGGAFPIGGYRHYTRFESFVSRPGFLNGLFRYRLLPNPADFRYIDYAGFLDRLYAEFRKIFPENENIRLYLEPGRLALSNHVYFMAKVVNIKADDIIIDGAYTNLPSIINEKHIVMNLNSKGDPAKLNRQNIFGPLPHVADSISRYYFGDRLKIGDMVLIADVGAYYYAMASDFIRKKAAFYSLKLMRDMQRLERLC